MIFFLNRMNWIKAVNNLITNSKAEGINHVFLYLYHVFLFLGINLRTVSN